MNSYPGSSTTSFSKWTFLNFLIFVAGSGCDSNDDDHGFKTEFRVRYEVTRSCDFIAVVGYTLIGGGATGDSITVPWSLQSDIDVPTPFTAVALSATRAGQGAKIAITTKIFVDGSERGSQKALGTGSLNVNVAITLNYPLDRLPGVIRVRA